MQNLLDNALKYGREKSTVTVEVKPATKLSSAVAHFNLGSTIVITVTDEGEGIAREHLPRLTERFYRVDPARSRSLGGTGLGLAIVKHIVNRHRGALLVDSTPGKGSVFSVYFPQVQENVKSGLSQLPKTVHLKA
jgi:two-component system phosphate regulon sensor histidine kinase PhoR